MKLPDIEKLVVPRPLVRVNRFIDEIQAPEVALPSSEEVRRLMLLINPPLTDEQRRDLDASKRAKRPRHVITWDS